MRAGLCGRGCMFVLLVAALAGCASSKADEKPSPSSPAAVPTVTDDTGSITVHVVDDELRPIAGATTSVIERKNESVTDSNGNATFNEVPPGTYTVAAAKIGYEQALKKVSVAAREVAPVRFQLVTLAFNDVAYAATVQKATYIHAGESILYGLALGAVNVSAVRSLECDPCSHVIYFTKNPKAIMLEVLWVKSSSVAYLNNDAFTSFKWNWTSDWYLDPNDVSNQYITGYINNGAGKAWSDDGVKSIKNKDRILLLTMPGYNGTVEQKEDFYTSFSYVDGFEEGFTALPPKS